MSHCVTCQQRVITWIIQSSVTRVRREHKCQARTDWGMKCRAIAQSFDYNVFSQSLSRMMFTMSLFVFVSPTQLTYILFLIRTFSFWRDWIYSKTLALIISAKAVHCLYLPWPRQPITSSLKGETKLNNLKIFKQSGLINKARITFIFFLSTKVFTMNRESLSQFIIWNQW